MQKGSIANIDLFLFNLINGYAKKSRLLDFFAVVCALGGEIKLGVIRVVGDGPGVPDVGMLPGGFADGESGLVRPSFHAASASLADDANVLTNQFEL